MTRYLKISDAAGLGDLSLHKLRHTFASIKASTGATLRELQSSLGHSDIKATMVYTHFTEDAPESSEIQIGPVDLIGEKK